MTDLDDLHGRITTLENRIEEVQNTLTRTEDAIMKMLEEVKPTLDAFLESSLGKMLRMGKKK